MSAFTLQSLMQQAGGLLPGRDDVARYLQDDSGLQAAGNPLMVLRPATTQEVVAIVQACHREGKRLTVQGGRTGLAGGAVPDPGDVVLSLERMNRVESLDPVGGTVIVQAGVILQDLCRQVEAQDWYFPMDCGARASCQVGGNVATNVGGNRVLRYGTMRELVLGLEVVLPDGTLLTMMNQGLKNNTGVDLKHLFIGTEGTLGIITRAVLRLFPKPRQRHSALVALASSADLPVLLKQARTHLAGLSSFEVMWREYLQAAARVTGLQEPFAGAHPITVLLEIEDWAAQGEDGAEALQRFVEECATRSLVTDAILPQSQAQAAQLWHLRDSIDEILREIRPFVAFDIGLPLRHLEDFLQRTRQRLEALNPQAHQFLFGHLGDGNLHLSTGPYPEGMLLQVESLVYQEVERVGGSISAEHGIGRVKKPFLHHSRSAPELALMRSLRRLIDPDQHLNTGRVIDF
ncbi:MAG TPA: FAD-binding oxidoreductase [Castellaniella sp.]|uniref:FAD-binding oxidoreductase n=1 Tax=Castellaniella sp. TaxID=1955812 RepID=UPI002F0ACA8A